MAIEFVDDIEEEIFYIVIQHVIDHDKESGYQGNKAY